MDLSKTGVRIGGGCN